MLRKSQPNFSRYLKKIEAQAKKWFSNKKNMYSYKFRKIQRETPVSEYLF